MERLKEIEKFAKVNKIPILHFEARKILKELILKYQPENILEIGTAIGFSGSLMLLLSKSSKLITIEKSDEAIEIANQNFKALSLSNRVEVLKGDATEIIKTLKTKFNFIFLDGPKAQYIYQLPFLLNLISDNGVILVDNILFRGLVKSNEPLPKRYRTIVRNLRKFIQKVEENSTLKSEILTIGDGLMIIKKKL